MDDEITAELWLLTHAALKRNRYRIVIKTQDGTYWRRESDKSYVLLSKKPNGEPKVQRLDR